MTVSKKMLGALLGTMLMSVVLVATAPAMGENAKPSGMSIDISGWQFTLTEPGWRINEYGPVYKYDSDDSGCASSCPQGHWKGIIVFAPYYFPAYPKAPKDNTFYNSTNAAMGDFRVVEIPKDFKKFIEDYWIAVYGSPDKVPAKINETKTKLILEDATAALTYSWAEYDNGILTTLHGHQAYLMTKEDSKSSYATAAVLLDDNMVCVIDVMTDKYSDNGAAVYKGKAKDVINAFTFEKEIV